MGDDPWATVPAAGSPDDDPWLDQAVVADGEALLGDVGSFLARFVAFPSEAARVAVTLWAAHTHVVGAFDSSPRLALLSPEPGSGKTRTLEILELLTPRPMLEVNPSVAVIFRAVDLRQPTLLLDEVDTIFGRWSADEDAKSLRSLLNSGHRRHATVPRCVGPSHEFREFQVYAACALAGLGDLPETLMSRSVVLRMRRRAPGEHIEPYRHRLHAGQGHELRERLGTWAADIEDKLADAWPEIPSGVTDRPADCWEPLLAVAEAAGGSWPERARAACIELVKVAASGQASLGIRLLADLRDIFGHAAVLATTDILDRLHCIEEAPWADLRGSPLDARRLARLLAQYEIEPTKVKIGDRSLRGYRREDLWDAWTRYLPAQNLEEAEPPEPPEPRRSQTAAPVPLPSEVPEPAPQTEPDSQPLTSDVPQVPQVPHIPEPCPHGMAGGDQPDPFVNDWQRCPLCRAVAIDPDEAS